MMDGPGGLGMMWRRKKPGRSEQRDDPHLVEANVTGSSLILSGVGSNDRPGCRRLKSGSGKWTRDKHCIGILGLYSLIVVWESKPICYLSEPNFQRSLHTPGDSNCS